MSITQRLACGAALWALTATLARPGLAELLLLLGPTLAVPLGLDLAAPAGRRGLEGRWRMARLAVLPAAGLLCLAFTLPPGTAAALLCLPWMASTALIALLGILRCVEDGARLSTERAIDAGLIFLVVGGVWTTASRWGTGLLGFGEPIVLLTGAHFHFAGFALPILCGLAARSRPGRLAGAAALGVVSGVPLTAIGITLGARGWPGAELATSAWLAVSAMLAALLQVAVAQRGRSTLTAALLVLSSVALGAGMALAAAYALGRWLGTPWLDIETMTRLHATANVLGFSLGGLLAWRLEPPEPPAPGWRVVVPGLGDRADLDGFHDLPLAPGAAQGPGPGDVRDRHELAIGREPPGPPVAGGCFERVASCIERFAVFPRQLATPLCARAPVAVGDALGVSYRLVPGVRLVFAARVSELIDEQAGGMARRGFTYITLAGHPFTGAETFAVEKDLRSGEVRAVLASWSRPHLPLIAGLRPLARRLQLRGARAILGELSAAGRAITSPGPSPLSRRS